MGQHFVHTSFWILGGLSFLLAGGIFLTYRNVTKKDDKKVPITKALKRGHVAVWLDGKKIKGGYALSRIVKGKLVEVPSKLEDKIEANDTVQIPQRFF